ncbi:unnamed protein product, partial [Pocillopora meandrina]
ISPVLLGKAPKSPSTQEVYTKTGKHSAKAHRILRVNPAKEYHLIRGELAKNITIQSLTQTARYCLPTVLCCGRILSELIRRLQNEGTKSTYTSPRQDANPFHPLTKESLHVPSHSPPPSLPFQ